MPLTKFDHVNIRTENLDAMVAWYGEILGLLPGDRPDFPFPGAWLYLGDTAIIHFVGTEAAPEPGETLRLEHISFRATGFGDFTAKLDAKSIPYRLIDLDQMGLVLVDFRDPDGNHLHVDFPAADAA